MVKNKLVIRFIKSSPCAIYKHTVEKRGEVVGYIYRLGGHTLFYPEVYFPGNWFETKKPIDDYRKDVGLKSNELKIIADFMTTL